MAFRDPVDITMFVQRRIITNALPFVRPDAFTDSSTKTLQLCARVWSGFASDLVTIGTLAAVYGGRLPNLTTVWTALLITCAAGDALLLLFLAVLIASRHKCASRWIPRLKGVGRFIRGKMGRFDIFVLQFATFKCLSLFQALFVLGQCFVVKPVSLSRFQNAVRIAIGVMAGVDALLNSVEMFAGGCSCRVHMAEVGPALDTRTKYVERSANIQKADSFETGSNSDRETEQIA